MKYFIFLLLANICISANAQNKSEKEPYLTKSFSGEMIDKVMAETSGGNITASGVNAAESKVEVFVSQNGNRQNSLTADELKTRVENDYELDVSVKNNKLTVTAKSKHKITDWKKALNFSFKIYIPKNAATDLTTSGGNISLSALSGDKEFSTSGGNLNLDGIEGKTKGSTSGGNINLSNAKDDIEVSTSGGNIYAEKSSGNIEISTSGGSIHLNDLSGKIKATTSGGNIKGAAIDGELQASTSGGNVSLQDLTCALKAATSGGNIDVSIKRLGEYVTINNSAGEVNLQIPKNTGVELKLTGMRVSAGTLENFKGTNSKEEIRGTIGNGGIPVTVDAGGGNINLAFN